MRGSFTPAGARPTSAYAFPVATAPTVTGRLGARSPVASVTEVARAAWEVECVGETAGMACLGATVAGEEAAAWPEARMGDALGPRAVVIPAGALARRPVARTISTPARAGPAPASFAFDGAELGRFRGVTPQQGFVVTTPVRAFISAYVCSDRPPAFHRWRATSKRVNQGVARSLRSTPCNNLSLCFRLASARLSVSG